MYLILQSILVYVIKVLKEVYTLNIRIFLMAIFANKVPDLFIEGFGERAMSMYNCVSFSIIDSYMERTCD